MIRKYTTQHNLLGDASPSTRPMRFWGRPPQLTVMISSASSASGLSRRTQAGHLNNSSENMLLSFDPFLFSRSGSRLIHCGSNCHRIYHCNFLKNVHMIWKTHLCDFVATSWCPTCPASWYTDVTVHFTNAFSQVRHVVCTCCVISRSGEH